MSKDVFDKKLAARMQSQKMQPDDALWSRIESTLDSAPVVIAPRKRFLSAVSTISAVAAILLLSFLLLNKNEPVEIITLPVEPLVAKSEVPTNENRVDEAVVVTQSVTPVREKVAKPVLLSSAEAPVKVVNRGKTAPQEEADQKESPVVTTIPEKKEQRSFATKSAAVGDQTPTKTYNERFQLKKGGKGSMSVNVSGAANFSSSSSVVGNNSGMLAPLKSMNHNKVPSLYTARNNNREWKHNMPLSFAVTFQKMFTRKIGIETGISYTYLYSKSAAENQLDQDIKQRLNYLGIPLSIVYSIAEGKRFGAYAKFGLMVDKALSAKATSYFEEKSQSYDLSRKGVQFSSMLQVGGAYNINHYLSLYLEPTVSYYFESNQPVSYRTDNDFGFSANVGVRFKF